MPSITWALAPLLLGAESLPAVRPTGWYWAAFIAYAILMIAVGVIIRHRRTDRATQNRSVTGNFEFWMAKRQLPGWRLAISLTSGWLMLGWIGFGMSQIYMYGATGLWILPIPWLILCFLIVFMVPFVRRLGAISLPQALEQRFGPGARILLAGLSCAVFLAWSQAELFMAGTLMAPFLGVDPWLCMTLFIIPPMIYTWLGGFRAVVITELFQFALMSVFMIILAWVAIDAASAASNGDIIGRLTSVTPPWGEAGKTFNVGLLGWLFPVLLLIGYLPGWLIEQDLLLRIQAAPSTAEARKGAWWGLLLIGIFVIILPAIIAFCALAAFPPEGANPAAAVGASAINIIDALIAQLPLGLTVFMFIGIIACQMSTIDTFANVAALAASYDIIEPMQAKRGKSWATRLTTARVVSTVILIASLVCALFSTSLLDVYYISSGVLSACIAIPAFFVFWRRTTQSAVISAAFVGFVGTVGGFLYEMKFLQSLDEKAAHFYRNELPTFLQGSYGYNYIALGVLLSLVTIVCVSLCTRAVGDRHQQAVKAKPIDDHHDFLAQVYPKS